MQTSKNSKLFKIILIVTLSLFLVCLVISFALLGDEYTSPSTSLKFGAVAITTNDDNWFSTIKTGDVSIPYVKPNDKVVDAVTFSLGKDKNNKTSQPCYVRAKCVATTSSTNDEIIKIVDSLNNSIAESLGGDDSSYKWSSKDGDYFYLLDIDGQPLAISSSEATYNFIKEEGLVLDKDLNINGNNVNSDTIKITIVIEAIQKSNLVADSGSLQNKIKTELDALVGNK